MKRKRFSLMTHLYDRHCNADVLRRMAVRRRQLSQSGHSEIPPPQPPPPHPGYAPNAAFHAIKRHALEYPKELLVSRNEHSLINKDTPAIDVHPKSRILCPMTAHFT